VELEHIILILFSSFSVSYFIKEWISPLLLPVLTASTSHCINTDLGL